MVLTCPLFFVAPSWLWQRRENFARHETVLPWERNLASSLVCTAWQTRAIGAVLRSYTRITVNCTCSPYLFMHVLSAELLTERRVSIQREKSTRFGHFLRCSPIGM